MGTMALALALFQDTSDQQQQLGTMMGGIGAGIILVGVLFFLAIIAFFIFLYWRIFTKAGMSGPLALLLLVPFGPIIVLCILAFGQWKVVPIAETAPYYPPIQPPPPPPAFPQQ
jgi:MFS family permease